MAADQRGPVSRRTHILAAEPHRAVGRDGQVPDRQPVQRGIQLHPLQQLAAGRVQIGQDGRMVSGSAPACRSPDASGCRHWPRTASCRRAAAAPRAARCRRNRIRPRAGTRRRPRRRRCRAHRVRRRNHFRWRPAAGRRRRTRHGRRNAGPAAGPVQRGRPRHPKPSAKKPGWRPKTTRARRPRQWRSCGHAPASARRAGRGPIRPAVQSRRGRRACARSGSGPRRSARPRRPFLLRRPGPRQVYGPAQRGPRARKRRRSIAIERVEADGHAQRGRQVLVDHRLGVLPGRQRPLLARRVAAASGSSGSSRRARTAGRWTAP